MARKAAGNSSSGGRKRLARIFQFFRWLMARPTGARIKETLVLNARPL